jgi:SAM-dependent methyltransferase
MKTAAFRLYQSHEDESAGMSDSLRKVARLQIPLNLTGKSLLDIGCNEGYFCNLAMQRGAERAVGIDFDKPRIEFARDKYTDPKIEFLFQRWSKLPNGPFDVILWTSAMHYELDPASVFKNVASVLSPNGLFILECGAIEADTHEMRLVQRHSDTLYYPTMALLRASLSKFFDVREIGFPEAPEGDPVPRYVFHCLPKAVSIVLLTGEISSRSFPIVESFRRAGAKQLNLPKFLWSIARADYHHSMLQSTIRDQFPGMSIEELIEVLDQRNLLDELIELVLKTVNASDHLVLLETGMMGTINDRIQEYAQKHYVVWHLARES